MVYKVLLQEASDNKVHPQAVELAKTLNQRIITFCFRQMTLDSPGRQFIQWKENPYFNLLCLAVISKTRKMEVNPEQNTWSGGPKAICCQPCQISSNSQSAQNVMPCIHLDFVGTVERGGASSLGSTRLLYIIASLGQRKTTCRSYLFNF